MKNSVTFCAAPCSAAASVDGAMYIVTYSQDMLQRYSIAEARAHLPRIVDQAEAGMEVELTRRGRAVAVVVSREKFDRLRGKGLHFRETYRRFLEKYSVIELSRLGPMPPSDKVIREHLNELVGKYEKEIGSIKKPITHVEARVLARSLVLTTVSEWLGREWRRLGPRPAGCYETAWRTPATNGFRRSSRRHKLRPW